MPEVGDPPRREDSFRQFCVVFLGDSDNEFIDLGGESLYLRVSVSAANSSGAAQIPPLVYCSSLESPSAVLLLLSLGFLP